MDVKIEITPEQIQEHIVNSIIKSSIGEEVSKALSGALRSYQFQDCVNTAVRSVVGKMVQESILADPQLRARVREAIVSMLTEKHLESMLQRVIGTDR